jgi:hypothetical protein
MWIRAFAVLFELRERVIQKINNPQMEFGLYSPERDID